MGTEYLSLIEASKVLPYSVRTLRLWCVQKKIKAIKIEGSRKWLIPISEIERLCK